MILYWRLESFRVHHVQQLKRLLNNYHDDFRILTVLFMMISEYLWSFSWWFLNIYVPFHDDFCILIVLFMMFSEYLWSFSWWFPNTYGPFHDDFRILHQKTEKDSKNIFADTPSTWQWNSCTHDKHLFFVSSGWVAMASK